MLSIEAVKKVAHLARLTLKQEELEQLAKQLSTVLDHFESLSKVNTEGVEPLVTPTDMTSVWRADEVEPGFGQDVALENAPEVIGHLFKVPPVVG